MKILFFLAFVLFSSFSFAEQLSCGSSQALVLNSEDGSFPYFGLSIFDRKYQKSYKFHVSNDFFKIKCVSDIEGKSYFLIKNTCSGTSCMDNFALIDVSNGQVTVKADKSRSTIKDYNNPQNWGNKNEIEQVLKRKPSYFICKVREVTKNEICLVSKIELG